jgi:hypothetical protein
VTDDQDDYNLASEQWEDEAEERRQRIVTPSSSPDPATPQWTWTDEAREELRRALGLVYPPTSVAEWRIDAVLAALAPHVTRQVADLAVLIEAYKGHAAATLRAAIRYEADRDDWMDLAAVATMEAARYGRQIDAVEALHQADGFAACRHCGYTWPCETRRALDGQQ